MWGEGLPHLPWMGKGGTALRQPGKEPREQGGLAALEWSDAEGGFPAERLGEAGRVQMRENTSAENNWDEHECRRDSRLR